MGRILVGLFLTFLVGCTSNHENEVWIYTSLYKDTISDIKPKLEKDFPEYTFHFYQAGSEEIAAKVNAEIIAGGTRADILISSDRFWYEELAREKFLHPFDKDKVKKMPAQLRHKKGLYNTLSLPVMVMAYNKEAFVGKKQPQSFKEMVDKPWENLFSTGSPLASGTNFTTVAFLSHAYGWDYFKKLQDNGTISEGGNSAVLRRIQSRERPVGWILLENLLRFKGKDKRLVTVFPSDGVVLQNNVLAIPKKKGDHAKAEKIAHWLFSEKGQSAMTRSFMYSPFLDFPAPVGAPPFREIEKKAFKWSDQFIDSVVKNRESIKEKLADIIYN